ncbi:pyruvate phosphate dikinase [Naegleria gruberi]|uniref:Pyruvate, phosphate dikinase n=1 Tax=Naegleria gruberi TaxID=5762 RepID=D2VC19_NAEGR|nr:pyruvate phosphate dikinase [Naegleria gruberi]EFC45580.1 pyruvate phosphate dikinase [Naegleria gruberi]|eukprot:XP_002678324.1 pyruvate phosphate dikinase [Naegleria gruberi strain NEG-M]
MSSNPSKFCYFFGIDPKSGQNLTEGNRNMKDLLGGKGANLSEMCNLGVPVPPGFTISTEANVLFNKHNNYASNIELEGETKVTKDQLPQQIIDEVNQYLTKLEQVAAKKFGSLQQEGDRVLLVSVRSGAAASMPGMMDTILNLGLCDDNLQLMISNFGGNERFVWDSYRNLIQMFGDVVMGVKYEKFEENIQKQKKKRGISLDIDLTLEEIKEIVQDHKETIREMTGEEFPQDTRQQMFKAIIAVFQSWSNKRAIHYRRIHNIRGLKGTAVNIQTMVFGNIDKRSCSGVSFSRNPSTGENKFYGEYLTQAQGEDVVSGVRTPEKIENLSIEFPQCYNELINISHKLEKHYKDIQDMEFTIEMNQLYMLQCRNGKKSAAAALQIYCDMLDENLITEQESILKIDASQLDQLLHKYLTDEEIQKHEPLARGLAASPGVAVGRIAFTSEQAIEMAKERKIRGDVILVRTETSPEDLAGMQMSQGFFTTNGGITSHAAVVARQNGKCCVSGCSALIVNEHEKTCTINGIDFKEGDIITISGSTGLVFNGALKMSEPTVTGGNFGRIMEIEKKYRTMGVYANADTTSDAKRALEFGAEGIGLCRTEHMFFEKTRIMDMRRMICATCDEKRQDAITKLKQYQKQDFIGLFNVMGDRKVTIRLLDPPLHEFLPHEEHEIEELANLLNEDIHIIKRRIEELTEKNPMLGHRGCRLGITLPKITQMQAEAIFEAAIESESEIVHVEIMIPLISSIQELRHQKEIIDRIAQRIISSSSSLSNKVKYRVGCMIETPRAALLADEIASISDFFSVGSNDLTQMTFGFSRDDAEKFLKDYIEMELTQNDPFQILDNEGVGQLIKMAVQKGRSVKPELTVGLCGEHGGEMNSVQFLHTCGLTYVSCSPFRIPIARIAACQQSILSAQKK